MKQFTVIMALADFVPVVLFAAAAVILQRDFYNKMSKGAFALFAAGTIDIVLAGALKAAYKLLYAAGACDFAVLSDIFLPLQAIGFMLAGVGMVAALCHRQSGDSRLAAVAVAPAVFKGTMIFVSLMVLGLAGMTAGFCAAGVKMKKGFAVALFVLSFICSLCMGYLSSQDFAQASMNWIAEGVNIVGQGAMLAGAVILHRGGLAELKLGRQ